MAKNTGKEFEELAQIVFNEIVNQKRVNTIKVECDVVKKGKSTSHKIDVY